MERLYTIFWRVIHSTCNCVLCILFFFGGERFIEKDSHHQHRSLWRCFVLFCWRSSTSCSACCCSCLFVWLVGWLVGWWVGGLVGWWVGGLVGWWVGGLGWLVGWLVGLFYLCFSFSLFVVCCYACCVLLWLWLFWGHCLPSHILYQPHMWGFNPHFPASPDADDRDVLPGLEKPYRSSVDVHLPARTPRSPLFFGFPLEPAGGS